MKGFSINVTYEPDKEELTIAQFDDFASDVKHYNKIRTAGDIGTACKDYVIGLESENA